MLALKVLKNMKSKKIHIYGYFELIISQDKGSYQSKHLRLRSYRSLVLDLLESFKEYHILVIPRKKNLIIDALAIFVYPNKKYKMEIKQRPTIPNNVDHCQVFDDQKQINKFMEVSGEF